VGASPADQLTVAGTPIDLVSDQMRVDGDLNNLNIAGLVSGSAHFELTKQTIHVDQGGSTEASLLTFGLSSLSLTIGTASFGVSITGGSVARAEERRVGEVGGRRWVAGDGEDMGAALRLGGLVSSAGVRVRGRV